MPDSMVERHEDRTRWAALRDHIESALQHIRDYAIVLIDPHGNIAGWNRGAEHMLGYAEDEVIGNSIELFFTPEDRSLGIPYLELDTACRTGTATDERWHLRGDGVRFFGSGTVTAVRDECDELLGFVKIFRDLTAQRRAVEQLAASERQYQVLVDSIKDYAIFMLDANGRVSYWTRAAERIKGYTSDDIIGRPFATFFTQEDRERKVPERELEAAREQGRVECSGWRTRKDGSLFWAEEVATALHDPSGACIGFSKITRDATERRSVEIERERLLRDATEANRLKDEFLSTISHELRTPLNAILGWLQLVRLRYQTHDGLSEALAVIERNARAQGRLIEDLLDASRIVTGQTALTVSRLSFAEPLAAAVETVRPDAYQKGIELHVHHDVTEDDVFADLERLQQIIWNLLSNAIKFTPRGGWVTVTTTPMDGYIELRVADTGVGIEPAFLPLVFDRFRQAETSRSRRHGGLGLGLSIVKHLVELHGGHIAVESSGRHQGTTVRLRIPRAKEGREMGTPSAAPSRATAGAGALAGVSVLVVDDDGDTRRMLELVLTAQGARVTVAASTRDGLGAARSSRPDVILADLAMPIEDGFELLARLRTDPTLCDIPAVAITAYARSEDRAQCLAAGFDDYLAKPVDMNEVIDIVARLAADRHRQVRRLNTTTDSIT